MCITLSGRSSGQLHHFLTLEFPFMVTILLPNYKTPELTKLCIRSLRKYTDLSQIRVIAIDSASQDESTQYLRKIPWIELIERPYEEISVLSPPVMHTTALDLALAKVDSEYVLSMHTDTIITSPDWLDYLLKEINSTPDTAGVGSWKLEKVNPVKQFFKDLEDFIKISLGLRKKEFRFLRSHCALYRTALLRQYTKGFSGEGGCAGMTIHKRLVEAGFKMRFLPSAELSKYMVHLNHATMIINPDEPERKKRNAQKQKNLQKKMELDSFREILAADDSADGI